jgi:iron complex outermembrane receptor protein
MNRKYHRSDYATALRRILLPALGVASLLIAPERVNAQPAATPAKGNSENAVEVSDIVVTAERFESTVQRTSATVEVLPSAQLDRQRITQLTDLNSVLLTTQVLPVAGQTQFTVRGIGSNFIDPRADPAVAFSVNGLFYSRPLPQGFGFLDVARVEAVEGPQGTLYGRNSAAGAVNVITNMPTPEFGGSLQLTGGNLGANEITAVANLPVAPGLGVRLAYDRNRRDGYVGDYYNDINTDSARGIVSWTATDKFSVVGQVDYIHVGGHGATQTSYPCGSSQAWSLLVPNECALPPFTGKLIPKTGQTDNYVLSARLQLDYDLDWATITSISGYVHTRGKYSKVPNGYLQLTTRDANNYDYSEEIRISGSGRADHRGGLAWQGGVFLFRGTGDYFQLSDFGSPLPPTGTAIFSAVPQTSVAGYAQVTYGLADSTRLTAGLRYTHDKKSVTSRNISILGVLDGQASASTGRMTYKIGVEQDLSPENLLYGTFSTGYISGGANGGNPDIPLPPNVAPAIFQPETVTAVEIGSKNKFFDNRLQLNGDVYYQDVKNYQSLSPSLLQGAGLIQNIHLQNVAALKTYGAELSLVAALSRDDRLTASASYNRARFGALSFFAFPPPFGPALTVSVGSGSVVPNTPEYTFLLGYEHIFHINSDVDLTASVNSRISSSYLLVKASSDPVDTQSSYSMTDAALSLSFGRSYDLKVFVKNIENAKVNVYGQNVGFHNYGILPPRTYGVSATARF